MSTDKNPWKILNNEVVHDTPWIRVTSHDVINPGGSNGNYSTVHFKNLAIGAVPMDEENNIWLVGQYRFPIERYTWEIPEGGGEIGIPPLDSAKRELREETGIEAAQWDKVLEMHLSNSATDEFAIIYLARQLSFHEPDPDEDEELAVKKISFEEAYQEVLKGELTDSLTVGAIIKIKLMLLEGKL